MCFYINFIDNMFCMLNIIEGIDFKCIWNWVDGKFSEIYFVDFGNFIYYNYSVVGYYNVVLNCINCLYNIIVEVIVIVEVLIFGFNVDDFVVKLF